MKLTLKNKPARRRSAAGGKGLRFGAAGRGKNEAAFAHVQRLEMKGRFRRLAPRANEVKELHYMLRRQGVMGWFPLPFSASRTWSGIHGVLLDPCLRRDALCGNGWLLDKHKIKVAPRAREVKIAAMALLPPTIVIFDMDGTTVRHLNPAVLHMLEAADNFAFRVTKIWDWCWRKHKKPLMEFLDEDVEGALKKKLKRKPKLLVHRAIHKVRRKPVEQIVEPCPGIYEVLKLLKDKNIPLALASNGLGTGYGHDILQKFELDQYFRAVIFREDVKKSKPHPEGILLALKQAGLSPTADDVVWHIGDRHKDVKATLAAREFLPCKFEPLAYGVNAAVAVLERNLGPDHIIMSYQDLFKKLKAMLGEVE